MHRLNRAEYANAVRDLLAVDLDVSSLLPPDDSSAGFDNNADVLGLSPVARELPDRRRTYQRIGDRRSEERRRWASRFASGRTIAGPAHRRVAARNRLAGCSFPRLPARRRISVQVRLFRTNLGTIRGLERASARDHGEWRTRSPRVIRRRHGDRRVERQPATIIGDRRGWAVAGARAGQGRSARGGIRSRRRMRSTRGGCSPGVPSSSTRIDFSGYPAHRRSDPRPGRSR